MTILKSNAVSISLFTGMLFNTLFLLVSCKQETENATQYNTDTTSITKPDTAKLGPYANLSIKFLWYDKSGMMINDAYCQKISAPEKAALGYVATFIGSECDWNGGYTDEMDNLECGILNALDLGYQCSDKHLGFLREWFRKDTVALKELENCPTVPFTANSQEAFEEITLTTKGNKILVFYKVSGINMREDLTWNWFATDHFEFDHNSIKLVKHEKSEVKHGHFDD